MAAQNPAIFLQSEAHPAEDVRRAIAAWTYDAEGVCGETELQVTQNGTPNMSVNVLTGRAFIKGDEATYQGTYTVENRGTTNLTISAADATNPRIDLVVAKVQDSDYSGATDAWSLAVVTGTPAASPTAPSAPSNSITLAQVAVGAAVTSIVTANITDTRTFRTMTLAGAASSGGIQISRTSSAPQIQLTNSSGNYLVRVPGGTNAFEIYDVNAAAVRWKIDSNGGFYTERNGSGTNKQFGFIADQGTSLELGRTDGTSGNPFIDFHRGSDIDYDARIICPQANTIQLKFNSTPGQLIVDNLFSVGSTSGYQGIYINTTTWDLVRFTSSERYKKNFEVQDTPDERLLDLIPTYFHALEQEDDENKTLGLIAERVEEVFPELVVYNADGQPDSVDYQQVWSHALAHLIKLSARVAELEAVNG